MGDSEGVIRILNIRRGAFTSTRRNIHRSKITNMVLTADNDFMFIGELNGSIKQWSIVEKAVKREFKKFEDFPVIAMGI